MRKIIIGSKSSWIIPDHGCKGSVSINLFKNFVNQSPLHFHSRKKRHDAGYNFSHLRNFGNYFTPNTEDPTRDNHLITKLTAAKFPHYSHLTASHMTPTIYLLIKIHECCIGLFISYASRRLETYCFWFDNNFKSSSFNSFP